MKTRQKKQNKKSLNLVHLALFVGSGALLFTPLFFSYNLKNLQALGIVGIGIINFLASATLFLPAPAFLAIGVGGKLYNPVAVAVISALGSSLGESVGFTFGYTSKKLSGLEKDAFNIVKNLFHHKYTPFAIILLALVPNPVFDAVGIVAGITLYPIKRFLFLVFIGRLIRDTIIAYAGHQYL